MNKHKHYDLIIAWCKNPQKYIVEVYVQHAAEWRAVRNPCWDAGLQYRLVSKVQTEHTEFSELEHNALFTFVNESDKIALGRCRKIIIPSAFFGNQRANREDRSMFMDESGTIRKCLPYTQVGIWKE